MAGATFHQRIGSGQICRDRRRCPTHGEVVGGAPGEINVNDRIGGRRAVEGQGNPAIREDLVAQWAIGRYVRVLIGSVVAWLGDCPLRRENTS